MSTKSRLFAHGSIAIFVGALIGLSVWSWALVDPNLTLVKHADWATIREIAVTFGYHNRYTSSLVFTSLTILLICSGIVVSRAYKGAIFPIAVVTGIIAALASYPALSHDLFNYIFDARILTHYGANPYLLRALDFPADPMLRFMHWVHRTYPYGPSYLLLSAIPSLLGMGIFGLTFALFRIMHLVFYVCAVWCLERMDRYAALLFALSPLVLIEGLMNAHNDFVALVFVIVAVYLIRQKRRAIALVSLLMSGLVKFMTLPTLILLLVPNSRRGGDSDMKRSHILTTVLYAVACAGVLTSIAYLTFTQEIQPWYFLNVLFILPFAPRVVEHLSIFFGGLILSYYPYVAGGEWGQGGDVGIKHTIILVGLMANIVYLILYHIIQFNSRPA